MPSRKAFGSWWWTSSVASLLNGKTSLSKGGRLTSLPLTHSGLTIGSFGNGQCTVPSLNGFGDLLKKTMHCAHGWLTRLQKGAIKGQPWFKIAKNTNLFLNFMSFKANDGHKIRFWKDVWDWDHPLEVAFPDLFLLSNRKEDTIAGCWNEEHRGWDLGFRSSLFDREFDSWLGLISRLDTTHLREPSNRLIWSTEGFFFYQVYFLQTAKTVTSHLNLSPLFQLEISFPKRLRSSFGQWLIEGSTPMTPFRGNARPGPSPPPFASSATMKQNPSTTSFCTAPPLNQSCWANVFGIFNKKNLCLLKTVDD